MPSTIQLSTPTDLDNDSKSRRFLKKGEGLKRFAAYKAPLPTTVKKMERRKTFVKFNLVNQSKMKSSQDSPLHFLPPEILNDDSINLSTEIPVIPPPKIMHTPVRPKRQALVTMTNLSSPAPGNCVLAVDRQIQLIESTIHELKETIERCECGVLKPQAPKPTEKPKTRSRRPVTRATAKAAKSQPSPKSDKSSTSTEANDEDKNTRPSAEADNCNSTKRLLNNLVQEITELKAKISSIRLIE